jgi:segregation and condensation protein B
MASTDTEAGLDGAIADVAEAREMQELSRALEALLFMSGVALSLDELCELTGRTADEITEALDILRADCEERAVWVVNVAGGFQLATRPQYGEIIARLLQPKRFRLSKAALETLAIVAYKQPATKPEVEEIRGVNVDGVMDTLLQYELIRECGRRKSPGRPIQYGTTDNFLIHFGLNSLQDLPDLDRLGRQDEVETEDEELPAEGNAGEAAEETVSARPDVVECEVKEGAEAAECEVDAEPDAATLATADADPAGEETQGQAPAGEGLAATAAEPSGAAEMSSSESER